MVKLLRVYLKKLNVSSLHLLKTFALKLINNCFLIGLLCLILHDFRENEKE